MNILFLALAIIAALAAVNLFIVRWFMVMTAARSRAEAQAAKALSLPSGDAATPAMAEAA